MSRSRTEGKEKGGGYTDYNRGGSTPADKQFQHSPFILDEHTSKVFRSNPRSSKGYTAQELQAALHDIQSGKLGTRRAAVIYGIPRSTLRNKVYKLGKDRGRLFSANGPAAALHNNNNNNHSSNLNNNNNNNNNNNGKGKEVSGSPLGKLGYIPGLNPSSYHHHQQQQLQRSNNVPARFTETDDEMEESPVSFVKNMRVPPSLYAINNNGDMTEGKRGELSPGRLRPIQPSLSQLISKHAHAQQRAHHHFQNAGAAGGSPMELGMDDSCQSSGGDAEGGAGPPLSHKDWKYALMRQEQLLGQQQARSGLHSANHRQPPSHSLQQQEDPATSLDLAGKKSRPKRGKYRNYDREALVKAVRAVQNGEMSVHRAGSFFGVPHSTLEYKVKEVRTMLMHLRHKRHVVPSRDLQRASNLLTMSTLRPSEILPINLFILFCSATCCGAQSGRKLQVRCLRRSRVVPRAALTRPRLPGMCPACFRKARLPQHPRTTQPPATRHQTTRGPDLGTTTCSLWLPTCGRAWVATSVRLTRRIRWREGRSLVPCTPPKQWTASPTVVTRTRTLGELTIQAVALDP